jgi:hypothetical protein
VAQLPSQLHWPGPILGTNIEPTHDHGLEVAAGEEGASLDAGAKSAANELTATNTKTADNQSLVNNSHRFGPSVIS